MTERAMGDLVQALAVNPKVRFAIVVPDQQRRRAVMLQLRELIRTHATLKIAREGEWELAIERAGHRDASVFVVIPRSPVLSRRFDRVVLDEVVNDPKDFWLNACVLSRLAPGGQVLG